jgi:hypothetical protein
MRNMIRNLMVASAVLATAALATTSAMASTLKVPFSFTVNGKQCPAGYYSVERGFTGNVVTVASRDGSRSFTWTLHPGDPEPSSQAVIMHFEAQGENHALQSVQYGSQVTTVITRKSKRTEYPTMSIGAGEGR